MKLQADPNKSGDLKRIGAYAHVTEEEQPGTRELPYHKDWSFRVVPLAAEASLVRGEDIRTFIENHPNTYDFFGRTKVPRNSSLEWGGKRVSNIVRFYVSKSGDKLEKVMPPTGPDGQYKKANGVSEYDYNLWHQNNGNVWNEEIHTKNKSVHQERRSGICTGYDVMLKNDTKEIDRSDLNIDWYVAETKKLTEKLR